MAKEPRGRKGGAERLPEDDRASELAQGEAAQAAAEAGAPGLEPEGEAGGAAQGDGIAQPEEVPMDERAEEAMAREEIPDEEEAPFVARLAEIAESIAEAMDAGLDVRHAGAEIRDAVLELFRHRPRNWDQMNEKEQRDTARLVDVAVEAFLAIAVATIAADDRPNIEARLEKFAVKGGKYQVTLIAQGGPELAGDLARLDGHDVLIISADAGRYNRPRKAAVMPDQPPLEFAEPEPKPEAAAQEVELPSNSVESPNPQAGTVDIVNSSTGAVLSSRPMTEEERAAHGLAEPFAEPAAEEAPLIEGDGTEELREEEEPPAEPAEEEGE